MVSSTHVDRFAQRTMQLYVFWRPAPMPFRRLPSLRSEERTRCGNQGGPGMKCPACGAEMHLMKVAPDKPMMVPGYEEHTFECSGCHDQVRRLVFMPRPIEPLTASKCRGSRQLGSNVRPMARCQQLLWSRALGAVARVNAMYVGGALIAIGLAGSMIAWGQGLKGQWVIEDHQVPKAQRAI